MSRWSPHILASGQGSSLFTDVLPWLLLLLAIVIVGFVVLVYLRRSITSGGGGQGQGFTLQDLRDLHASGQLSDEEFEQARAAMIGRLQGPGDDAGTARTPRKPGNASESRDLPED